jgi:ankyrin repeat protein
MSYRKLPRQGPEMLVRVKYRVSHDSQSIQKLKDDVFVAIWNDDMDVVQRHVAESRRGGLDGVVTVQLGRTPLHVAINMIRISIVELLLQAGADLYQPDDYGLEPVTSAFQLYCLGGEEARPLGKAISFEKHQEDEDYSDLHKVVTGFLPISLEEALQKPRFRAQVNMRSRSGLAPLHFARFADTARRLTGAGADPNCRNLAGQTPLIKACGLGNVDLVEALLDVGADPDLGDHGQTPLTAAAGSFDYSPQSTIRLMEHLLAHGADPNQPSPTGATPLQVVAATGGSPASLELLLQSGAAVDVPDENGETALWNSILYGTLDNARLLLNSGAGYRVVTVAGQNVLHLLAEKGTVEMMDEFSNRRMRGVDPNLKDTSGKRPRDIIFERAEIPSKELREAFERLLAIVEDGSECYFSGSDGPEAAEDANDFHDAVEIQNGD